MRRNWYHSRGFESHSETQDINQGLAGGRSLPFSLTLSQTALFSQQTKDLTGFGFFHSRMKSTGVGGR